jgi:hypothetical protein
MLGGERGDIEQRFWNLTGACREETTNLSGTWVFSSVGGARDYFRLVDRLALTDGDAIYYPMGHLPENTAFVLRQEEIRRFVDSLASSSTSDGADTAALPGPPRRWPWGDHHTALLGHLADAAQRFWVNVDPADNTTAPTNDAVASWLVQQGVSKRMADAMASMLRPDWLPTGPRTSS